jgi:hypothetical protein
MPSSKGNPLEDIHFKISFKEKKVTIDSIHFKIRRHTMCLFRGE